MVSYNERPKTSQPFSPLPKRQSKKLIRIYHYERAKDFWHCTTLSTNWKNTYEIKCLVAVTKQTQMSNQVYIANKEEWKI